MNIRAITFDFWSTLYRVTRSSHSRRLQRIQAALASVGRHDIAETQVAEAVQQAWIVWDRVWREEHRTFGAVKWLVLVLDDLGVVLPRATFTETVHALETAHLEGTAMLADGTAEMLARLAPRYRLGLISDTGVTPGWVLRALLKRDGLLPHFTHLIFSDEFGHSKPHPAVFLAILDRLGVQSHQAVHVGDLRHTDISGARGIGMRTVRYAGIRDDRNAAYPDADAIINTHADLKSVLEKWNNHA